MKEKWKLLIAVFCSAVALFAAGLNTAYANNSVEFKTTHDDELSELFKMTAVEVSDPLKWVRKRNTYLVVEKRDDGGVTAWINAPTLQAYLYNTVERLMPNGYDDTVIDLDSATAESLSPTSSSGNTGLKKWGFSLPSNTYYGEWPTIQFDASALFPTQNFWSGFKSLVRTVFGGNIFNELSKDNFGTLYYDSTHDYIEDYSYVKWIGEHWDNVCEYVMNEGEEDYPLLTESFCGNKTGEFDGTCYTFKTVIMELGFSQLDDTPERFNQRLKARLGPFYNEVMFNMIALDPDYDGSQYNDLTKYPLRMMPYEKETLMDDFPLADDPRAKVASAPVVEVVHVDILKFFKNSWSLNASGKVSSLALFLNGWCSLGKVNEYVDTDALNNNAFLIDCFIFIIGLMVVIRTGTTACKFVSGKEAAMRAAGTAFATLIAGAFIVCLIGSHDKVTNLFNKMLNVSDNFALSLFENGTAVSDFADDSASSEDMYDMIFWMPYINGYALWNTNHTVNENAIVWDGSPELDEHDGDMLPSIGSKQPEYWFCVLIKGFTESENELDLDVYRVVDHFLAPRLSVDFDAPSVSSTVNENFNGYFQTTAGGCFAYSLFILAAVVLKLCFFACLMYNFMFLYAYAVKEFALAKNGMAGTLNELLFLLKNIGTYTAANIALAIMCYYSSIADASGSTTFSNCALFLALLVVIGALFWNRKTCPKMVYSLRDFLGV